MPQIFMIAGPNGAGKTTSAMVLLPETLKCTEYVNADSIAAGISPFKPEEIAFTAGRLMLNRIHQLVVSKTDFAFETTGASRSFATFLSDCKILGYEINLIYLWLESTELALARIASRVEKGGHDIPRTIVKRRYRKSLINLFSLYLPIADNWHFYNNSEILLHKVAEKNKDAEMIIYNQNIWNKCVSETNAKIKKVK